MLLFLILISSVHCQSDSQSAGSHDSAYESIISQYYTNDPYFGSGPPSQRYSTKEEALDRLKQIIKGRNTRRIEDTEDIQKVASFQRQQPQMNMQHEVQRNTEIQRNLVEEDDNIQRRNFDIQRNFMMPEENMVEENNPSVNRRMIPAPLLASVKGFSTDERDDSMDGIPAPLLVGGAFRIKEEDDSRFAKKTLKVEDDHYQHRPKRMHVRKIKKRKIANNNGNNGFQERSVFSELIGGQRQQQRQEEENEDDENIDVGLIGNDEDDQDEDVDNRGFFEEPNFGFNTGREKFNFPGDSREDIPLLPEIENMNDREPAIYRKPYQRYPEYPKRHSGFTGYPAKRHSYHQDSMDHYNPMDSDHNPRDVDVFNPEPRSFHEQQNQDPFFMDIPKINVNNHLDYQGPKNEHLERFHKPDISSHLSGRDEHHIPPYRNPHRQGLYPEDDHHDHHQPKHFDHPKADFSYSGHSDQPKEFHHPKPDFSHSELHQPHFDHPKADFSYSGHPDQHEEFHHPQPDFSHAELEQPHFKPPRSHFHAKRHNPGLPNEPDFPTFDQIERTAEPRFVSDMPHLPPPPEMLELQKNSLFPVDVPKIGSAVTYRPPELIFDEYHRRIDFPKESEETMEKRMDENFGLSHERKAEPKQSFRLSKFSDMIMQHQKPQQQSAKSSNFGPPAYSRKADENWNELPSFSEKPVKTEFETFEAIPQSFNEKSMQYYPEENEDQPLRFDRYDSKPIRFNPYSKNQEEESLRFQKYSEPRYKKPVRFQQERSEERSNNYSGENPSNVRFEEYEAMSSVTQRYNPEDYEYENDEDYDVAEPPAVQKPKRPPTTPKYNYQPESVTSRYYNYDQEEEPVAKKPIMLKRKESQDQLPRRPTPESFHETIQDQFQFNQYENEALTETEAPVYVPKTTYKYENDYKEEMPLRAERMPETNYANRRYDTYSYEQNEPEYYQYNPMDFAAQKTRPAEPRSYKDFPELPPFEEMQNDYTSRAGAGRSLVLHANPQVHHHHHHHDGPKIQKDIHKNHQFIHVEAPHSFKSGYERGNSYHHINDIEERQGPFHLQEVKWNDVDEGYGRHYFEYNHDYKTKTKPSEAKVPIRRL